MSSREELFAAAVAVLRRGEPLTLDAVAREGGLSKPGVVHHFGTKGGLVAAVVEYVLSAWETELESLRIGTDPRAYLRAYVDHAFTAQFDPSDLAMLLDARTRETFYEQWQQRLAPWLGETVGNQYRPAGEIAARLLADGYWINTAAGIETMNDSEKQRVHQLALGLLTKGGEA
ncbi:MAG: TetR family transcriptional regulator [Aeromicrobium sp.]|nr:MAG: TetR family transcriptional regulator [Aeromicrobium sp.]